MDNGSAVLKGKGCECQTAFTAGSVVTKFQGKSFCPGEKGLEHCVAVYFNKHLTAAFWAKQRSRGAGAGAGGAARGGQ